MRLMPTAVVTALTMLFLASPAFAEVPGRFGGRVGVSLSAFTGDLGDQLNPDNRIAPSLAFVYEYDFAPKLAFHTELGYAGKGGVSSGGGVDPLGNPTGTSKTTWRFDYLEVPLLLRGRLQAFGTNHVFAELGPVFDFRLTGKFSADPPVVPDVSLTSRMNALDVGFGAGFGFEFPASHGRLGLETRYTRGFSDLYEVGGTLSTINQAWTFAVSLTL